MAILKKLTDFSYILETDQKEKIGIVVDYSNSDSEKTGIEFFSTRGRIPFESMDALSKLIGDNIKYEEVKVQDSESKKFIEEYPINETDSVHDLKDDEELKMKTFSKSKRSKKRFLPGWWIVTNTETSVNTPRLTISVDTYKEKELNKTLHGPFKTYMEVTFQLKKL